MDYINMQLMREPTNDDFFLEKKYEAAFVKCQQNGQCPTCENAKFGNVYFTDNDLILFENDLFLVLLEQKPRRSGHTILIIKPHFEDVSEMPKDIVLPFYDISKKIIDSLKLVLHAKKVYLVTMCDGGPNHLHFQFIPRYENENHGSKVFVSPRMRIKKDMELINSLKLKINK